jgi:outer membrane protein insertion porin family
MWATTVEYRFPVAKKVYGVVFGDAGRAWSGINGGNSWKKSFGVGVRMNTPLGSVRLDYGKGDETGRFHFSFGGQF